MTAVPFSRGINFTKWFEARTFEEINFEKFNEKDFSDVKTLGVDVIRLPVAFHNFVIGDKDFTLNPELLKYLDTAADWAEKYQIYLIIDNHSFHPINPTDENIDKILIPVWEQLARRFSNRSGYMLYEILNEPHGITDKRWGEIQGNVIDAIRKFDKDRPIIVGGTNFNSIEKLFQIPVYTDKNLIYTFHFYDPHMFTHQGATWNKPSLDPLSNLPFPAPSNFNPQTYIHETFKGTWIEDSLKNYENDSKLTKLSQTLERPVLFSKDRNVPVFCGEFGVFMKQSPKEDRVSWYKFVCAEFKNKKIPWICWDYFGGFGIFKTQSRGVFPDDLDSDIVQAMGLVSG
jgi:endoglucanase